ARAAAAEHRRAGDADAGLRAAAAAVARAPPQPPGRGGALGLPRTPGLRDDATGLRFRSLQLCARGAADHRAAAARGHRAREPPPAAPAARDLAPDAHAAALSRGAG